MITKADIKNIGIFMFGGIGNYLMITPMLRALKDHFAIANVTLIVAEDSIKAAISEDSPVDSVINISRYNLFTLIKRVRGGEFDLTITATGTNPLKGSALSLLSGARYRIGENIKGKGIFYNYKLPYFYLDHEVEGNSKLLSPLNIKIENPVLFFPVSQKDKETADKILKENRVYNASFLIAIHAGSGERLKFKRWGADRFAMVAKILSCDFKAKVIFLGGASETGLVDSIIRSIDEKNIVNVTGKLTIKESAAVIKKCKLLISNDTCLMHIASALDVPVIALFGPTMHYKTGPYGNKHKIVKSNVDCCPCYDYRYRTCKYNNKCMDSIEVSDVMNAVRDMLDYG